MYWPDVEDLRRFYSTSLGKACIKAINNKLALLLGDCKEQAVLGIGYTGPFVDNLKLKTSECFSLMPASQGIIHWPDKSANRAFMAHECELPIFDNSVEKVLLIHALENTSLPEAMISEIWRILTPGGKLIMIAPNRGGLWARLENNPFGSGRPYSKYQGSKLLSENLFTVTSIKYALHGLPSGIPLLLKISDFMEKFASRLLRPLAGVIIFEAEKQVYAVRPIKVKEFKSPRFVTIPQIATSRLHK